MITIDSDPALNPINLGAKVINIMAENDYAQMELQQLYEAIKYEFNASYDVFVYTLDWLFVIGAISLNGQGMIEHEIN